MSSAYTPTCRDPTSCGTLTQIGCDTCYWNGGVVDPSQPLVCYCPATTSYSTPLATSCSPPVQLCSGSYLCDPSCLTCSGSSNTQCLSCSNAAQSLFQFGSNPYGQCVSPCLSTQFRGSSGTCQNLDCSSFNNCTENGVCYGNTTSQLSACSCFSSFTGSNCSIPLSCPTLSNCNGHGACSFNTVTESLFCQCNVVWTGPQCTTQVSYATSTLSGPEVGGSLITITSSASFTMWDNVTCAFGGTAVTGFIVSPVAYCIAPPHFSYSVNVPFVLLVNGTSKLSSTSKFSYTYSNQLLTTYQPLSSFFWPNPTTGISYTHTSVYSSGSDNVQVHLYQWSFDPFDINVPNPVLVDLGVIASGPNIGTISVDLTQPSFLWTTVLYVLSLQSGLSVENQYLVLTPSDFGKECAYFGENVISVLNSGGFAQSCPSPGYTSYLFETCSSLVMEPVIEPFNAPCVADPDFQDICLYPYATPDTWYQLWEPFKFSLSEGPVVQYFSATQLPSSFAAKVQTFGCLPLANPTSGTEPIKSTP